MTLGNESTLAASQRLLPEYQRRIANAPYEDKGVLFSEILFVWAAMEAINPPRVLESGRARGVSTYLLSVCFDKAKIISVEYDRNSADVPIAAENLRKRANVEMRFGDATELLPELASAGDAVVIDGPKHFRGLRLAFAVLERCKPAAVFIHDVFVGSVERNFLTANAPGAFYSDDPAFVKQCAFLDARCWEMRKKIGGDEFPEPYLSYGKQSSYGPTFACIPYDASIPFAQIRLRLLLSGFWHRFSRSVSKRR